MAGQQRLSASFSLPALGSPTGSNSPSSSRSGLLSSSSRGAGIANEPACLMPACYAAHKAMSRTMEKNPFLFSGAGFRLSGQQEPYFLAENRSRIVNSTAYSRRQLLVPEIDILRRSLGRDPWPTGEPRRAGCDLQTIHKDTR
mmetsp:Transcript_16788/g.36462  ORF Transcript_16788/g.36462 Transcript_16788/m.36462 type:complete len:143 (-) Transcript_16788:59-487(-)